VRKLQIDHVTDYRFDSDVTLLPHRLMLRPRESHGLRIAASTLEISPAHRIRWQRDALDNSVAVVSFSAPAASLRIASRVVIEHYDEEPLDFYVDESSVSHPFQYGPADEALLAPMRSLAWPDDRASVTRWLQGLGMGSSRVETFALLDELNRAIPRDFRYEAREEPGVRPPARTISLRSGSCRDFAALFIEATRQLGFASRFVTGYHTSPARDTGAGSTHAWAEVYLPGPGWKGFDPTGGVVTGSEHIAVAYAAHPESVPPVSGSYVGPGNRRPIMQVSVRVVEI
jgi:transglutaminase-like putative cysteine protease